MEQPTVNNEFECNNFERRIMFDVCVRIYTVLSFLQINLQNRKNQSNSIFFILVFEIVVESR